MITRFRCINKASRILVLFAIGLVSFATNAQNVSGYLPLNLSLRAEAEIDRVIALTHGAALTKPYKVADLQSRLKQIQNTHPMLYRRITLYLKRFERSAGVTHASAEAAAGSSDAGFLPNGRGKSVASQFGGALSSYIRTSDYAMSSFGAVYNDEDGLRHTGTMLSLGIDVVQMDIGYREHWFSPFKHGAMLSSTHAEASPSITLSNVTPISDWNIRYELFYSKLEPVERIRLGDEFFPGSPRHAGLHLSFSPVDFWTIGVNRTLQFGGGQRDVGFGDFFEALFDPAGKDNIDNRDGDPNFEFGNQQASITTRFNLNVAGMPFELYGEYGGEDTLDQSNYRLGNQTVGVGVFFPFVTDELSLRYEFNTWAEQWYVHHIYVEGYTNNGVVMGHWGAGLRGAADGVEATVHTLSGSYEFWDDNVIDARFSVIQNGDNGRFNYETGYQFEATYSRVFGSGLLGVSAFWQRDTFGDDVSRLSVSYTW